MSSALSEKLFDPSAQLDAPQFPNSSVTRYQSNRCETTIDIKSALDQNPNIAFLRNEFSKISENLLTLT